MKPSVSVIVPTIGRVKQLQACLQSLIQQSILPDEIVVVDNSSYGLENKQIGEIPLLPGHRPVNIKYIREKRMGVAFARNAGIKAAKNDLIAFIDDDCIAEKTWVKSIVDFSNIKKGVIIQGDSINGLPENIFACIEHFNTQCFFLSEIYKNNQNELSSKLLIARNCAFKKSTFTKFPYFDGRFAHFFEDTDFGLRSTEQGVTIIYKPKVNVIHYGRTTLISHLRREFNRGKDFCRFQMKWKMKNSKYKEIAYILENNRRKKIKQVKSKLMSQILEGKSYTFKLLFHILLISDDFILKLGVYLEKVKAARIRTRIFLPRKIRVRKT